MIKTRYIVKRDYDNRRLLKGEQLYISKDKKYLMNYRTEFICDINSSWFTDDKVWDCTTNYTETDGTVVSLYSDIWVTPNMAMEHIIKKILNYEE